VRHPLDLGPLGPTVDQVALESLYEEQRYEVTTVDGWSLVVTRFRPIPQDFHQPVFGEPLLLVHGFGQNRHAWTSGQFVKNLLFFGADLHILELRGHGRSSLDLQRARAKEGSRLPGDLDYGWDIDSYFLYDLPAAVEGVKQVTGREKIFLCGHSMGGMLAYGYAGIRDDLEGLITIGAPSELGKGFPLLRLVALAEPGLSLLLDGALAALSAGRRQGWAVGNRLARKFRSLGLERLAARLDREGPRPDVTTYRYLPIDHAYRWLASFLTPEVYEKYQEAASWISFLANPSRATGDDIRWLLEYGGEREPRGVVTQFARWIRRGQLTCYRSGYDFKRNFPKIDIPMAIIFGDLDRLASMRSTASIYRAAQSEYLLWRPVKGNSHVEITMGHDIRQICYDVKNLIDFAAKHRGKRPSLPRVEAKGYAQRGQQVRAT
jgi:pimeloyl-ACP methyl ester carboxylesterase